MAGKPLFAGVQRWPTSQSLSRELTARSHDLNSTPHLYCSRVFQDGGVTDCVITEDLEGSECGDVERWRPPYFTRDSLPNGPAPPPPLQCMLGIRLLRLLPVSPSLGPPPLRSLMDLGSVVSRLDSLTPPALAESWDNVGLLVEPSPPHHVHKLLLTNDLTEDVLEEALSTGANMVLSYHPPIFRPLKRLTAGAWKERLVVKAIENRLAVYSPHTACDALSNGVNDWLGRALGRCEMVPIKPSTSLSPPGGHQHVLEFSDNGSESLLTMLAALPGVSLRHFPLRNKDGGRVRLSCPKNALRPALALLSEDPGVYGETQLLDLLKPPLLDTGMGRLCTLAEPLSLSAAVERIKLHVGLQHLRLALGRGRTMDSPVRVMAVCAGSGSSILSGVPADLYLTGEMSHHEVLDAVAEGRSVVLCEHSNSERGYLQELRGQIAEALEGQVEVLLSQEDRDPLLVV